MNLKWLNDINSQIIFDQLRKCIREYNSIESQRPVRFPTFNPFKHLVLSFFMITLIFGESNDWFFLQIHRSDYVNDLIHLKNDFGVRYFSELFDIIKVCWIYEYCSIEHFIKNISFYIIFLEKRRKNQTRQPEYSRFLNFVHQ